MTLHRRALLAAGLVGSVIPAAVAAKPKAERTAAASTHAMPAAEMGLKGGTGLDQTALLQQLVDRAAQSKVPLALPAGELAVGHVQLRPGTRLVGHAGTTTLKFLGGAAFLTAIDAADVLLQDLALDGDLKPLDPAKADGLLLAVNAPRLTIRGCMVRRSLLNGVSLRAVSGTIGDCVIEDARQAGLRSIDAQGLAICDNTVASCANNGILVWRQAAGEDGTIVAGNRISHIGAAAGGTGENGNGINVFRAGNVLVTGNRITDCAYTAIRGNAASNIQMVANSCARLGEVALYAEFGFEGALIASNLVDGAATGISVTNFNEGGRLGVVQGNLIRNLARREHEIEDKRGEGIAIEADCAVTGNTIEGAATAGIAIGWGKYMREVVVSANVVRASRVGIMVTSDPGAGSCLVTNNMISGSREGAIRAMDRGVLHGPDLARSRAESTRVVIAGNVAV